MTMPKYKPDQAQGISQGVDNRQLEAQESTPAPLHGNDIPLKYQGHYKRAMTTNSRQAAIRAQCLACCGWNSKEVRNCTTTDCTLHKFRIKG